MMIYNIYNIALNATGALPASSSKLTQAIDYSLNSCSLGLIIWLELYGNYDYWLCTTILNIIHCRSSQSEMEGFLVSTRFFFQVRTAPPSTSNATQIPSETMMPDKLFRYFFRNFQVFLNIFLSVSAQQSWNIVAMIQRY